MEVVTVAEGVALGTTEAEPAGVPEGWVQLGMARVARSRLGCDCHRRFHHRMPPQGTQR